MYVYMLLCHSMNNRSYFYVTLSMCVCMCVCMCLYNLCNTPKVDMNKCMSVCVHTYIGNFLMSECSCVWKFFVHVGIATPTRR